MPPEKGKKNANMARFKDNNGRWEDGHSSDYQRRITKAKKGELVHHKDGDRTDNAKSNLQVIKPSKGKTAIGNHNAHHDRRNDKLKK